MLTTQTTTSSQLPNSDNTSNYSKPGSMWLDQIIYGSLVNISNYRKKKLQRFLGGEKPIQLQIISYQTHKLQWNNQAVHLKNKTWQKQHSCSMCIINIRQQKEDMNSNQHTSFLMSFAEHSWSGIKMYFSEVSFKCCWNRNGILYILAEISPQGNKTHRSDVLNMNGGDPTYPPLISQ